jgi:hypothetical protein
MKRRAFLRGLGAASGLAFAPAIAGAAPGVRGRALDRLREAKVQLGARITLVGPGNVREPVEVALGAGQSARRGGRGVTLALTATSPKGRPEAIDLLSTVRGGNAAVDEHDISLRFGTWSRDNYVALPGFCYAGNRFQARRASPPPLLIERADIGPHVPPIVPNIARLSAGPGPSALTADVADLATPALAVQVPGARLGIIVLTRPTTDGGSPVSLTIAESDDRAQATVSVVARGRGDIQARVYVFDCADVPALFERLYLLRKDLTGPTALVHDRPFSALFAAHEARVNGRWVEKAGYLAVGDRATPATSWQTGWRGGFATTLPLIATGAQLAHERALATVTYVVENGQTPLGFFHGISDGKTWSDDGFAYRHARRWHLVRRTAETLTLLLKQVALLERHPERRAGGRTERWAEAARRAADALVKLWERNKQLGQFVDIESGELIVGGSTSAGIAPAGLALAAAQLKEPRYLDVAKAIGEHYYDRYVRVGLTCGGPGDALQAPDSESAAALLDSFVTLYEATRDRVWIDRARGAAHLLASWVISYDAPAAGRGCAGAGVRATGAVFWSAAARRGSPGYVLSSGDALFRLHRATGEVALLELLRDTVHNLAQYLPETSPPAPAPATTTTPAETRAAPCAGADSGRWLDARDGGVPVDGMFDAIGLLSYTEVPGIYVRPDAGFLFVFDHVTARIKDRAGGRAELTIANPTRVPATVRILTETTSAAAEPLRAGAVLDAQTVGVPAGGTVQLSVAPQ